MATVSFSENNIYHNKKRTAKLGLLSILNRDEFNKLVDKYYRDENGNLHCAYTWEILSQDNLELEHIIPVSLGGGTVIFNCVPSSSKVNGRSEKYNNYLFDWWKNYPDELLEKLINYIFDGYEIFISNGFQVTESVTSDEEIMLLEEQDDNELEEIYIESQVVHQNLYIYYTFLKDCVDRLEKKEYQDKLEALKNSNIFNMINEYDEILQVFKDYLNEKSLLDLTTIAINCNLPYFLSKLGCTKDNFILTIDKKINDLYIEINKKSSFKIGIDSILANINNIPEIILYDKLDDKLIEKILSSINYCKSDKLEMVIEYYRKNNMWPSVYNSSNIYNFSMASFIQKIRSGEIQLTEEQMKKILVIDSKFFMNQNMRSTEDTINEIIEFYKTKGRRPKQIHNPQTEEEKYETLLAHSIYRVTHSSNLTDELKRKLLSIDPLIIENLNEVSTRKTIDEAINYYKTNGKWPTRNSLDEKTQRLAASVVFLRTREDNLPEYLVKLIKTIDPRFFENQAERKTDETVQSILDFYDTFNRWPIRLSKPTTEEEKYEAILAGRLQNIRFGGINITELQRNEMLSRDENVFEDQAEQKRVQNYKLILDYFDNYHRWPRILNNPQTEEENYENDLGNRLRNIRKSTNVSEHYRQEFLSRDSNIFMNQNDRQTHELILQAIDYFDSHGRWPLTHRSFKNEEEEKENSLALALSAFRSRLNPSILETHRELIFEILKRDNSFFENQSEVSVKKKLNDCKRMYISNGYWPKSSESSSLNSFMSNVLTGKIALTDIQINELESLDSTLDLSKIKRRKKYFYIVENNEKKDKITKVEIDDAKKGIGR